MKKTLNEWIEELRGRFDDRDLRYLGVQKAMIQLQLKDAETGEVHIHNVEYKAKDAPELKVTNE